MFKKMSLFLSTLLLSTSQVFAADATSGIDYMTEDFPPFNFRDPATNIATGINTDVLVAMFKEMGSDKSYKDIQVLPWAHGYETLQDPNAHNMLYSMTRTPARDGLFKWVGPLTDGTHAILVLNDNAANVSIKTPADFAKYKFAAIRDDIGDLKLKEAGVPEANITRYATFEPMIKSLLAKHVDAVSYSETVSLWLLKKGGYDLNSFKTVYSVVTGQHYFAFNKSINDDVVKTFQTTLDKLKTDPTFMQKIKDKYIK